MKDLRYINWDEVPLIVFPKDLERLFGVKKQTISNLQRRRGFPRKSKVFGGWSKDVIREYVRTAR